MDRAQVAVEISALRESFLAMRTNEWFLFFVETLVGHQVGVTNVAADKSSGQNFNRARSSKGEMNIQAVSQEMNLPRSLV